MNDMILLKQGEIVLKGQNRRTFEARLIRNVKNRLKPFGDFKIYAVQSTVYVEPQGESDMDGALEAAKTWTPEAAAGVSMTLIGEGVAVWNKTASPVEAYLLAAAYDDTGYQSSVSVTPLQLASGERAVLPVRRGGVRLMLCDGEWRPLTAPLDG